MIPAELERLDEAVQVAKQGPRDQARERATAEIAVRAWVESSRRTRLLLTDPGFLGRIQERIRDRAGQRRVGRCTRPPTELVERFRQLEVEHLRSRGEDLIDVARPPAARARRSLSPRSLRRSRERSSSSRTTSRRQKRFGWEDIRRRRLRHRDRQPNLAHHHHRPLAPHSHGRRTGGPDRAGDQRRSADRRRQPVDG